MIGIIYLGFIFGIMFLFIKFMEWILKKTVYYKNYEETHKNLNKFLCSFGNNNNFEGQLRALYENQKITQEQMEYFIKLNEQQEFQRLSDEFMRFSEMSISGVEFGGLNTELSANPSMMNEHMNQMNMDHMNSMNSFNNNNFGGPGMF